MTSDGTEPPDAAGGAWRERMEHALGLALQQAERTDPQEVPVGAVVLDPAGHPIARASNARESLADPTAHAEILAIRQAARERGGWRLTGCTLAVTLEPCVMCAGALVQSRIDVLVYGTRDPKAGAVGSLWDLVRDPRLNHRCEVIPPDLLSTALSGRCSALLNRFFAERRLR